MPLRQRFRPRSRPGSWPRRSLISLTPAPPGSPTRPRSLNGSRACGRPTVEAGARLPSRRRLGRAIAKTQHADGLCTELCWVCASLDPTYGLRPPGLAFLALTRSCLLGALALADLPREG